MLLVDNKTTLVNQLLLLMQRQLRGDIEFVEIPDRTRPLLSAVVLAWEIVLFERDSTRPRIAVGPASFSRVLARVFVFFQAGRVVLAVDRRRRSQRYIDGQLNLIDTVFMVRLLRLL